MNQIPALLPDPSRPLRRQEPPILLAMCIFGEARGSDALARRAVAQVVINRCRHPHPVFGSRGEAPFDDNLRAVILQPHQFSSMSEGDPNHAKLWNPLAHETAHTWESCLATAQDALKDAALKEKYLDDPLTRNSDHYFDDSIQPPAWASPAKQTVKIGRLNFYRLYLPSPGETPRDAAEPGSPAHDRSSGSRPPANAPVLFDGRHAVPSGRCAPAPEPQSLRPHMSLPALKSSRALICGPRPSRFQRADWSRGLSLLALLGILLAATACSDFEKTAYRVLSVSQAEYETTQQKVAEAAVHGLITEEQWNRFQVEGHRFIAAHNAAVDAFQLWSKTKSKDNTARATALLEILPRLIAEINTLVQSFDSPAIGASGEQTDVGTPVSVIALRTSERPEGATENSRALRSTRQQNLMSPLRGSLVLSALSHGLRRGPQYCAPNGA